MSTEHTNFSDTSIGAAADWMWLETVYDAQAIALPLEDPQIFPPTPLFLFSDAGNTLLRM